MGKKKRKKTRKNKNEKKGEVITDAKTIEHIKRIEDALKGEPKDLQTLRQLAVDGFVNDDLRKRVWPILLGVTEINNEKLKDCKHAYTTQVEKDIERSMYHFDVDKVMTTEERTKARRGLKSMIDSIFKSNPDLHYIQGFHDICSVFFRVCGEELGKKLTEHLSKRHIRDSLRPNLEVVENILGLIFPLIDSEDPELFQFLSKSQVPPFFALSWVLTWFAHNVERFNDIARLYDFFLASHPLMPLYYSVVIILNFRDELIQLDCEYSVVYAFFQDFKFTENIDENIHKAFDLSRRLPPSRLCTIYRFPKDSPLLARHVDELENLKKDYSHNDFFDIRRRQFWTHLVLPIGCAIVIGFLYSRGSK